MGENAIINYLVLNETQTFGFFKEKSYLALSNSKSSKLMKNSLFVIDSKIRYGVYACLIWNSLIAVNILLRSHLVNRSLDLSSVGMKLFFVLWSLVMFAIGYYGRRDYLLKEQCFIRQFKKLPSGKVAYLFRLTYWSKLLLQLTYVALGAIPWIILGYWGSAKTSVIYIFCSVFLFLAGVLYVVRRVLNKKIEQCMVV